ncbi:MAG: DNA polymerase (family 10) [Glaciecola sp.]
MGKLEGIGKSTAAAIREWVDSGTMTRIEEQRALHPPGKLELLRVPGLGPKSIAALQQGLGIVDLDSLREGLANGKVAELPGMGEKTAKNLAKSIEQLGLHSKDRRVPSFTAVPLAEAFVSGLRAIDGVLDAQYAGSLRRFREDVGDLDLLVSAPPDRAGAVMAWVAEHEDVDDVIGHGETKTSIRTRDGVQVDVRVVAPESFGAALLYFTGSKAHNIKLRQRAQERGLTLNEYELAEVDGGARVASRTEADVYEALGQPWIPAEIREDTGEFGRAQAGPIRLVELGDLLGDLHDHTTASGDGKSTLEEMVAAASDRGFAYLAITDHAEDLRINGVSRAGMLEQRARIRELQEQYPDMALLHGVELNMGADGSLDYDQEFLEGFDWCVASVHSHFRRPVAEQTARIVAAIRNPAVNVIGHLTGRMLGKRPGIDLDLDPIFEACVETGTALEINANLKRLDASAEVVREGIARGVWFVISTDAHHSSEYDNHVHGVRNARRAGAEPASIANTWNQERFLQWAKDVRGGS